MTGRQRKAPKMAPEASKRIYGEDPENITVESPAEGGLAVTPEALAVLKRDGVAAHAAWVRKRAAELANPNR
jgi:hypothetical protein